jgi:glycosyltransferase involved in cell wall biosynthesis
MMSLEKPRPQTIACCMIVKNEAANLARCLASVRPFVDQLHIVDTGSADGTPDIAGEFDPTTVRLAEFEDFATARNLSLDNASGYSFPNAYYRKNCTRPDWILWIDADEVLIGGENLRKYTRTRFHEGYAIQQVQVHMQDKTGKTVADTPIRLFRNRLDYKFVGIIHEHPENTAKGPYDNAISPAVLLPDVEIHHFGYTTEKVRRGKVTGRNMALMIRSLLEEPDRQLTRALALRDLTNVAAWHFTEHGPIDPDSVQHRCLQAAVDAWIDLFGDEDHKYHGMSYPFYQEALVLLAANGLCAAGRTKPPFCVAWGVLGSMMALDKTKLVGRVRWWPDEQQFTQFVLHSCAAVVQQLAVSEAPRAVKPVTAEDTANLLKLGIAKLG